MADRSDENEKTEQGEEVLQKARVWESGQRIPLENLVNRDINMEANADSYFRKFLKLEITWGKSSKASTDEATMSELSRQTKTIEPMRVEASVDTARSKETMKIIKKFDKARIRSAITIQKQKILLKYDALRAMSFKRSFRLLSNGIKDKFGINGNKGKFGKIKKAVITERIQLTKKFNKLKVALNNLLGMAKDIAKPNGNTAALNGDSSINNDDQTLQNVKERNDELPQNDDGNMNDNMNNDAGVTEQNDELPQNDDGNMNDNMNNNAGVTEQNDELPQNDDGNMNDNMNNDAGVTEQNDELPQNRDCNMNNNANGTMQISVSAQIRDIDDICGNNSAMVRHYALDIHSYLYDLENQNPVPGNIMEGQLEITFEMRSTLIDWMANVGCFLYVYPESFQLSVVIVDRFLQSVKYMKRSEFQLVGATALLIAIKYEEMTELTTSDFVYLMNDSYTAVEMCQMELKILRGIHFCLWWPLPIHFFTLFTKAADAEDSHSNMTEYFMELFMGTPYMVHYKSSEITAAALMLSLNLLKSDCTLPTGFNDEYWTPTLQHYTRYGANHLKPLCQKIATMARDAPYAKLKSIYIKYQSDTYEKVSLRPELFGALINSIIDYGN